MIEVSLGIDVEPDCPPYLATQYRGMTDGLPTLLDLLDECGVRTTCFTTGQIAERFPGRVEELIRRGHELGSHGHTHRPFDTLAPPEARAEVERSSAVLRSFGTEVASFRAPNLRFPPAYLPLLEAQGYRRDSSQAKYKAAYYRAGPSTSMQRFPASTTSSVLRLPRWIRDPWLATLSSPVVLFVHPWEFVDLRATRLRLDCRFGTGAAAVASLREVIGLFRRRGARFVRLDELGSTARAAA